ncbi:hypothetical protein [Brenneria roseae]|nr:hypothetical protein [Brenneria roseae]
MQEEGQNKNSAFPPDYGLFPQKIMTDLPSGGAIAPFRNIHSRA